MKLKRVSVVTAAAVALLVSGMVPSVGRLAIPAAQAQNFGQRVIIGSVINDESAHVAGATLFLRNAKTKSIRSYTSDKDGRFRFAQVNMAEDFELWAEKDGKKSPIKNVSSWDTRKEFECELKLK
jgi:hypothetical protein